MEDFIEIKVPDEYVVSFNQTCGHTYLFLSKKNTKEEKWQPQDGDIVTDKTSGIICIYAGTNGTGGIISYAGLGNLGYLTTNKDSGWGITKNYCPATDEEKQRLFDALAKAGKRWNTEEKRVEDLSRWRAEEKGHYCYLIINSSGIGIVWDVERGSVENKRLYEKNNYFKTREAAERVAAQIREIFKNSKAE